MAPRAVLAFAATQCASADERRVALVIGNANYVNVGASLRSPVNDAKLIAEALRDVGFTDVVERHELGLVAMRSALEEFRERVEGADWAVLYYAGYGIEFSGKPYCVPVDARIARAEDIPKETIALDRALKALEHARKLQLAILDTSFDETVRPGRKGGPMRDSAHYLGEGRSRSDVLIAFSTKGVFPIQDLPNGHGAYATALAQHLRDPNLDLLTLFNEVSSDVVKATNNRQVPFVYGSVGSDTRYFAPAP
jgi:uncharacterized caspase-like protein